VTLFVNNKRFNDFYEKLTARVKKSDKVIIKIAINRLKTSNEWNKWRTNKRNKTIIKKNNVYAKKMIEKIFDIILIN
jgi:hypothetical protein